MDDRTKYKRKLAIFVSIAAVVVIAVITIFAVLSVKKHKTEKYYEVIRRAESYIMDMDYSAAIREYEMALQFNDKKSDVYEKLVVLYEKQGDIETAKQYAIEGYQKTRSMTLSEFIDSINKNGTTGYTFLERTSDIVTMESVNQDLKKLGTVKFRIALSDEVLNQGIDDFIAMYGNPSFYSNDEFGIADFGIMKVLYPSYVTDVEKARKYTGDPIGFKFTNINSVFEGNEENIPFNTVCEVLDGVPEIKYNSSDEFYYLSITYLGCIIEIESDSKGNINNDANYIFVSAVNPNILTDNLPSEKNIQNEVKVLSGSVSGKIKDAATGVGISDCHLVIRKNSDQKIGDAVAECDTDSNGNYFLELEDGNYCVEIQKNGYIAWFENIQVIKNVARTGIDIVISTELKGQIRIVLTWGADPTDLDSYLTGTTDSGENVVVNFMRKYHYSSSMTVAWLDVDDRTSYGPETTTINDVDGVYYFDVQDYFCTGNMSKSGAKVIVYLPDNTSQTIEINESLGNSNIWHVFKIDHGVVTVLNN